MGRSSLESEAILEIITLCRTGEWELLSSTALELEIARTPDVTRREEVQKALALAQRKILVTKEISKRAIELTKLNIKSFDALHIACAEAMADVFLTTDNRLLSKALSYKRNLNTKVANPITWLAEVTTDFKQGEGNDCD